MRIVYYVAGWPPDRFPNGVVSATASLLPALRSAGHEARVLSYLGEPVPGGGDDDVSYVAAAFGPGVPVLRAIVSRLAPRRGTLEDTPRKIARRINEAPELAGADIVEMEESFGWSRLVGARIAPPVVTRLHGPYFLTGAAGRQDAFSAYEIKRVRREGVAIRSAPAMTAPSQFVLNAVRTEYQCALKHAVVIPNAARPVPPAQRWRREQADSQEILFVGRFDAIKGADIMLEAFARLAATAPWLRLTFAGPNDAPMKIGGKEMNARAFAAEIMPPDAAARISFLGLVPHSSLGALRRRAFVTVVASRVEMFANVVLEALAHGSPVVATRVGGIPEVMRDGVDGMLVPAEDPQALASAIGALLDNPDLAARFGENGARRAEGSHAPEGIAAMTVEYYREVLARTALGAR